MIAVSVRRDKITIDGHAGYAKAGNDIICAAVSALAQGMIHSLTALTEDEITYTVAEGHIDIYYKSLSEQGRLLVDSFFIAVSDIQATYGKEYVQVM